MVGQSSTQILQNVHFILIIFSKLWLLSAIGIPHLVQDKDYHVYDIAAQVASKYYSGNVATLTWTNCDASLEMALFLQQYDGSLLNQGNENTCCTENASYNDLPYEVTQYFINIRHIEDLEKFLSGTSQLRIFLNTGKFIVTCLGDGDLKDSCDAQRIFEICWKHYLTNIVLLHQSDVESTMITTYYPMSGGKCDSTEPSVLEIVKNGLELNSDINLFPNKVHDFNGCPLILSVRPVEPFFVIQNGSEKTFELGGTEGLYYRVLAEALNATLQVVMPRDKQFYGAIEWCASSEVLGNVIIRRANISSLYLSQGKCWGHLRAMYPRGIFTTGWATPPTPLGPLWIKLISPLQYKLRIYLTVLMLSTLAIIFIIRATRLLDLWNSHFVLDKITGSIYINTWAILLGQVARIRPRNGAVSFIFALWLWFNFIVRNAYQGALINSLKQDLYNTEFETARDFIDAGYEYGGPKDLRNYIIEDPKLYSGYKNVEFSDVNIVMDSMANEISRFIFNTRIIRNTVHNLKANGTKDLNIISNTETSVPVCNYLPIDSPLADTLDTIQGRIVSSGLEVKFWNDFEYFERVTNFMRSWNVQHEYKLTMHHMLACFFVIIAGWLLSALSFILELCWFKYRQR